VVSLKLPETATGDLIMIIGIPKEVKDRENRVSVTPEAVKQLVISGHKVRVELDAGLGSGFSNSEYEQAGAKIVSTGRAWQVELVVKVKEPLPTEYLYLADQMVFTFFHLAGVDRKLTEELLKKKTTAIAYETLEDIYGNLPILAPMSAVAGNMASLMGSYYLARYNQGKGMQLGQVLGKSYGKVVILGNGVVGQHAARVAQGMGANVYLGSQNLLRLGQFKENMLPDLNVFVSTEEMISLHIKDADLVIGAVLCRGAKAPKLITEEMVMSMEAGSVLVDVSIDQGGCIETSRPTSHSDPVYIKHEVLHYCVTNMPGAYPKTSTMALSKASLPYIQKVAAEGVAGLVADSGLLKSINTFAGKLTSRSVAEDLKMMSQFQEL